MSTPSAVNITDAVARVVSSRGLEGVTVRSVAAEAGVAIGTVQHWFPTKDALIVAAFEATVTRIRARVDVGPFDGEVGDDLVRALSELLPLDSGRASETLVHLAFAARGAVDPALAERQAAVLGDVRESVGTALRRLPGVDPNACDVAAAALAATVDGLALHGLSAGAVDADALTRSLTFAVRAVITDLTAH